MFRFALRAAVLGAMLLCAIDPSLRAQESRVEIPEGEWPFYGRDPGGERHSPLAQINRENVAKLQLVWTHHSGEKVEGPNARKVAYETTPIMIDGVLYFSSPGNRIFAVDAATGEEKWRFHPEINLRVTYSELTSRGVSSWVDREATDQPRRIFMGTLDARLICLDAATGKPVAEFGDGGVVDLSGDVKVLGRGNYQVTSPPAIVGDVVVIGTSMGDNRRLESESGMVRGYDARTGKRLWAWDPIPRNPGDPGYDTWKGENAHKTGAANAWTVIAADPERGLVFVPTSCPSPDFYGGERLGQNLFANSLVAIRAATGEVAWHYQIVHHDIWDYDLASPPALITLERDGKKIPAVVQATKMGYFFVLHRETGEPLFPVDETPVPKSDIEGEKAWPTQPIPRLPKLGLHKVEPWGATEEQKTKAAERIAAAHYEGDFTPPSLKETIIAPANIGGANWSGVSFDPSRQLLVTNVNRFATVVKLMPTKEFFSFDRGQAAGWELAPQAGTPYAMMRQSLIFPEIIPMTPPPFGTVAAIDLSDGTLKWEVPLGYLPQASKYPGYEEWGSMNLGGTITTAGGLVFIAASLDAHLRAFDIETGKELWKGKLPFGGHATPMTYMADGKQFVAIAAGGHGKMASPVGDALVAFTLP